MTTVSDDFNRSNEVLGSPNWTAFSGRSSFRVISNQCGMGWGDGACGSYWSADTFGDDTFAEATVKKLPSGSTNVGVCVRHTSSQAYIARWTTTYLRLVKWTGGVATTLGSDASAPSVNDVIRIEASGSSISVYQNGSLVIGPITDTELTSGPPGVFGTDGGDGAAQLDDWSGGDLSANYDISIGVGAVTATTYAPSADVVSGPIEISISVGSVTSTTYTTSADVGSSSAIPINVGSQQFSTYDQSLNIGFGVPEGTGPEAAFPDDTNVGITGYTVSVGGDYAIGIGVGSVSISTYDLTVSSTQGTFIPVDVGAITTTGYAPVDVSSHVPSPGTATQTITGYIPLIGTSHFRTPDVVEITITGYDVSTAPTTDIYIDVGSGEITSASSALSLIRGIGRAPGTATLGFTGYTPFALTEDVSWEFFPDEGSATYSTYDLTLSIIEVNKSIPIAVGSLVIPGWKLPFGTEPSVEVGARKRRKILGFLK